MQDISFFFIFMIKKEEEEQRMERYHDFNHK